MMMAPASAHELGGALSINRRDLAAVLHDDDANRLEALLHILERVGITSRTPLPRRLVRLPLREGERSLLDLLTACPLDVPTITSLARAAKALADERLVHRRERDARLLARGFEEPTELQRKSTLALNVALLDWPKT